MSDIEMLLVTPKQGAPPDASESIAEWVALRDGLILMATGSGALIVALGRAHKEQLAAHPLVALVGGVTLSPHGQAAKALQRQFADNAARQLAHRASVARTPDSRTPDPLSPAPPPPVQRWPVQPTTFNNMQGRPT